MTYNEYHLEVNLTSQTLTLMSGETMVKQYPVSTAKNGPGETLDSECTPTGKHIIAEKIGAGCEVNTVFVGRKPTGEKYNLKMKQEGPDRDWILTRILWLSGSEPGVNQGGNVDSYNRYIYIHGSPDDVKMGAPGSRGCIRMRNSNIVELFNKVEAGIELMIFESGE